MVCGIGMRTVWLRRFFRKRAGFTVYVFGSYFSVHKYLYRKLSVNPGPKRCPPNATEPGRPTPRSAAAVRPLPRAAPPLRGMRVPTACPTAARMPPLFRTFLLAMLLHCCMQPAPVPALICLLLEARARSTHPCFWVQSTPLLLTDARLPLRPRSHITRHILLIRTRCSLSTA